MGFSIILIRPSPAALDYNTTRTTVRLASLHHAISVLVPNNILIGNRSSPEWSSR